MKSASPFSSEFAPKNYQKFTVSFKSTVKSVCLYHVLVTQIPNIQTYSFYFRYNTLEAIHKEAKKKSIYPKSANFPPKKKCFCHKSINRESEFQSFFNAFKCPMSETEIFQVSPNESRPSELVSISNISILLDLMGLESIYPVDLMPLINNQFISNPFDLNLLSKMPSVETEKDEKPALALLKSELPFTDPHKKTQIKIHVSLFDKSFEFVQEKKLGKGGYGEVYLYSLNGVNESNHKFAIKFLEFNSQNELLRAQKMNSLLAESKILTKMEHPNIVRGYFYHKTTRENVNVFCNFMEFCNSGSLFDILREKKEKKLEMSEEEIKSIFLEILKGMQYTRFLFKMRGKRELLVHRDLKPDNIFFHKEDKKTVLKIGDFGLAKVFLADSKPNFSLEASKDYQSPEMSNGKTLNEKCDIWSLGVILYEMFFLELPWPYKINIVQTYKEQKRLLKDRELSFDGKTRHISEEMQTILKQMLQFNEKDRISFEELFQHDFFREQLRLDMEKTKEELKKKTARKITSVDPLRQKMKSMSKKNLDFRTNQEEMDKIDQRFFEHLISIQKIQYDKQLPVIEKKAIILEEEEEKKSGKILTGESVFVDQNPPSNSCLISGFASESIKNEFKKTENKIIFLDYFDEKLKNFIDNIDEVRIVHKIPLRLMLQKVKLGILHKLIKNIEMMQESGGIWPMKSEFKAFLSSHKEYQINFMGLLNDSIGTFASLQEKMLGEVLKEEGSKKKKYLNKEINVYDILELINPQIKKPKNFVKSFGNLCAPIVSNFKNFIEKVIKNKNFEGWSEQQKNDYRSILVMYRNFLVLGNIESIFGFMTNDEVKEFTKEFLKKREGFEFDKIIEKMGI